MPISTAVLLGISERFAALDHAIDYHGHDNGGEYGGQGRVHIIVQDDLAHLLNGLGRGQDLPARRGLRKLEGMAAAPPSRRSQGRISKLTSPLEL